MTTPSRNSSPMGRSWPSLSWPGGPCFIGWIIGAASIFAPASCRSFWKAASAAVFILVAVASPSPSWSAPYSARYDSEIDAAVARFWPDFPYPLAWKAQLFQESRLNPAAVSPVGARGLAQFMPATWAEVQRDLGWADVSPHAERQSIYAGAYYMAKLRKAWKSKRPVWDRQWLAQASYNGGMGNLLKAQKLCGGPNRYDEIIRCLPKVTGKHSKETIDYIERIARHWSAMAPGVAAYRRSINQP